MKQERLLRDLSGGSSCWQCLYVFVCTTKASEQRWVQQRKSAVSGAALYQAGPVQQQNENE
jgi:hypothetical protein